MRRDALRQRALERSQPTGPSSVRCPSFKTAQLEAGLAATRSTPSRGPAPPPSPVALPKGKRAAASPARARPPPAHALRNESRGPPARARRARGGRLRVSRHPRSRRRPPTTSRPGRSPTSGPCAPSPSDRRGRRCARTFRGCCGARHQGSHLARPILYRRGSSARALLASPGGSPSGILRVGREREPFEHRSCAGAASTVDLQPAGQMRSLAASVAWRPR